jgi:predicted DNA-binding protein YlxM (UPF0122 family)
MYEEILSLRREGNSLGEISKKLNKPKSTISVICKRYGLSGRSDGKIEFPKHMIMELNDYYKTHISKETSEFFGISVSVVKYHVDKKRTILSDEDRKLNNYKHVKNFRQKLKDKAINYKGNCCEKCGYNRCNSALEFHHLDPNEKDFGIGSYSVLLWEKIKLELDKCIMVCANCHREIHYDLIYNTAHIPSV